MTTRLHTLEHRTVAALAGPILIAERAGAVAYEELVEVVGPDGAARRGRVLEIHGDRVVVQVLDGTHELDLPGTVVRSRGRPAQIGVGPALLGRMLDGSGRPIDGGPPPAAVALRDLDGAPINPVARDNPCEFIETGVSAIDLLNTLVRGQKLPIFSSFGFPAMELAATVVERARVPRDDERFVVVFAAMGITHREAEFFRTRLAGSAALERAVLFFNLAGDPAVERLLTPRAALTAAEHLAWEHDMHVLVVLTDLTNYCEALREVAAAREEIPGRRGYPGYMYSDLASLLERAGRIRGRSGSITQLPILSMPDDDITHPIPDLTGYITEGQIVLSRDLARRGIDPPVDVLPSLSRLMDAGVGEGRTREDHRAVADQLYALVAAGRELRRLVAIIGDRGLSDADRRRLAFADMFERRLVHQPEGGRTLEESLTVAWDLLADLPADELTRLPAELRERYGRRRGSREGT